MTKRQPERPIDRAIKRASDLGMSKSQFAARIGVDPQSITNWIARGMPPARHQKVAEVLNWSVDQLIGREKEASVARIGVMWPFEPPYSEYLNLTAEQKRDLQDLVEDMMKRFRERNAHTHGKKISDQ